MNPSDDQVRQEQSIDGGNMHIFFIFNVFNHSTILYTLLPEGNLSVHTEKHRSRKWCGVKKLSSVVRNMSEICQVPVPPATIYFDTSPITIAI